jgi:hypothetical protein
VTLPETLRVLLDELSIDRRAGGNAGARGGGPSLMKSDAAHFALRRSARTAIARRLSAPAVMLLDELAEGLELLRHCACSVQPIGGLDVRSVRVCTAPW